MPSSELSVALSAITESAPLAVDTKAKAFRAAGRPVIAFGAGEPDFATPDFILDAVAQALRDESNHHYSPPAGLPMLREKIAAATSRDSGISVEPQQVVVTNGGKQAVFNSLSAVTNPGDEILLPAPYWTTYPEAIKLAGGTPVTVFAGADQDYKVTVDQLEAARTERTKALIFTSPSNPTGAVYSEEEVRALGKWADEAGIFVITDEIYQHFVYDGYSFTSIARFMSPDRCIILNGLAKSYVLTGWRLGWAVAPAAVAKVMTNFQSHTTGNVSNLSQRAAIAALDGGLEFPTQLREVFDRRREVVVSLLSEIPGFRVSRPRGAFYVYPDITELLQGNLDINGRHPRTSMEFADALLDEVDVAIVPGEAFGPSGYLRMSYALKEEDLREGIGRIKQLVERSLPA